MKKHPATCTALLAFAGLALTAAAAIASGPGPTGPSSGSPRTGNATVAPDEYRLETGDKLRIEVYKDPQLSQSVQVRPDGKITLPLVGDVEAGGHTPLELGETITRGLKEYMTNPVVTVIVVETVPATAYVTGEVNHPGAVTLLTPLTVLQALAVAGGLKDFANAKNIRVLRKTDKGERSLSFNYKDAIKGQAAPVYLQAGDTVVVPD